CVDRARVSMNIALISLIALCGAIAVSGVSRVNIGILAMSLAWLLGYYLAGMPIGAIVAGFPLSLATMLFGVTFLFSLAQQNGTLGNLAGRAIGLAHGHLGVVPLLFFLLPLVLATIGPGNIAAVALIAPLAMAIAGRSGISAFLMTLMVANGANAGAFSPFAPTGIIANGLIARQGLVMDPWTQVYLPSLLAQGLIAVLGYLSFGGLQLWHGEPAGSASVQRALTERPARLTSAQWVTVGAIAALIVGVVVFKADLGFLAITLALVLAMTGTADQEAALKAIPWDTIIMVCGVSVLVAIVEKTGGLDLFTSLLARVSTARNIPGVIAFVAGAVSAYSSSSGVVMPTFIPMVPGLIAKLGGGDPVAIVSAINVGSHVVDVSPLSTLGAICIANAAAHEDHDRLFRRLLIYGLAMALIGALVCYLFFGLLW
ncbi:MAG TPA: SLC13 family permease, partial [Roseiflexaceae bacterium]|nr:SLC13 family permease [Roseiflexaceae bacterium]